MTLGKIDSVAEKVISEWITKRRTQLIEGLLGGPIVHDPEKDAERRARLSELKELEDHLTVGVSND